jgi:large subunit ribosomal protein L10
VLEERVARTEKVEKVAALKELIEGSEALLLADYRGLTVVDTRELRSGLRDADAAIAVVKNTLLKLAAGQAGIEALEAFLDGPTAVAFIKGDPVLAAKRLSEAQKKFPALEIKGGYVEGRILTADDARALARLESREAMLSMIAGMAKGEMSRAASMFQALQGRFLGLLEAFKDKVPGETPPAETPAGETPAAETPAADDESPGEDHLPGGEGSSTEPEHEPEQAKE